MELQSPLGNIGTELTGSVPEYVCKKWTTEYADKVALINADDGHQVTYKQLMGQIKRVATGLHKAGLRKGQFVLILSPNNIEYPVVFHACGFLGAVVTTCNPLYKADELAKHLNDAKPVAIFTTESLLPTVYTALNEYSGLSLGTYVFSGDSHKDHVTTHDLLKSDEDMPEVEVLSTDLFAVPYSSGTTGFPKGVMQTHISLITCLRQLSHPGISFLDGKDDVIMGVVPFYHILGLGLNLVWMLGEGATLVVMSRFEPEKFIKNIEKYKVTAMPIVPPIAVLLTKHPLVDTVDTTSLRHIVCAAAPLGKQQVDQLIERLKINDIRQIYGMTETLLTHSQIKEDVRPGSVGVIAPGVTAKVIDEVTGELLPAFKRGEICMKSDSVMIGYLNNKEATIACIDKDGFMHSGDVGYYDDDGHFYIVDRIKDLIKYNAFQVSPAELESVILAHPSVAEAAVVGIPDEKAGELPRALIIKKPNHDVSEDELKDFVKERLAPQKQLRGGVEFVTQIPKLPSGKILRRVLRNQIKEKFAKIEENVINNN